jgi:tetratricopeptide (TPR) repeat protein
MLGLTRVSFILTSILILLFASAPVHADTSEPTPSKLLKQAQSLADPHKKIELLDQALKETSIKPDLLSQIFYERALAFKAIKDYFKAIEDFDSSAANSSKHGDPLVEKAYCLIMLDQLEEARRVVDRVLTTRLGSAQVYVLKGMIYERQGSLSRAADEYTRALAYDANYIPGLQLRANVLVREGKPRKGLDDLNALAQLEKSNPDVLLNRARVQAKLKNFSAALSDYARVESLRPGDETVIKEKVETLFKSDKPEKALESISAFVFKHPADVEALVLQSRAYMILNNRPAAEKNLRLALSKEPRCAPGHLYLGVLLAGSHYHDRALDSLNRAIELDQSLTEAYKERAKIFVELKEPVRAGLDLTGALDLDPADVETLVLRASTFMQRMLYEAAIADLTKALDLTPGDPRILYERAAAYTRSGEFRPALADLDSAIQSRTYFARAFSLRGMVNCELDRLAHAREDFDKSVALDPKDPYAFNNRGFFHFKMNEFRHAVEDYKKALELQPNYETAKYNLNLLLTRMESENQGLSEPAGGNPEDNNR